MKKLWQKNKNQKLDPIIEAFETKDDLLLDQKLVKYDVSGSIAHAKMLNKIGILSNKELDLIKKGLNEILKLNAKGKFNLEFGDEDIHTKIENYLTQKYGEVGKKIHTGRSRNDQVLTAIRLFSKDKLNQIEKELLVLTKEFNLFVKKYGEIKMPGYTHMQKAMPSSIAIWAESFEKSLNDDLIMLKTAQKINDQSPLGSAAGYGVSLPLDKNYTAKLLGFEKVQNNPLYCQNSKGKIESLILSSLIQILLTINKFSSDVLLFTTSEFDFFEVCDKITSGSSIMPQKKNVDIAELLRSKVHLVLGNYTQLVSLSSNLVSGYNRDLQDIKKPLFDSLETTLDSIKVAKILLNSLTPNKEKLKNALTSEIFATEKALELVKKGIPFREAYQKVGSEIMKKKPA
ncbi:MAG: argininosuccinate lyase [Candidatus Levybacteria bacterium]|nr:argininosuccinate lyase [Candidatus Levybacteria bacterium]